MLRHRMYCVELFSDCVPVIVKMDLLKSFKVLIIKYILIKFNKAI